MNATINTPRIYVASLSDYNAGILHGAWIVADQDADMIHQEITEMLIASPATKQYGDIAEEWSIHDTDGFPNLGENPQLETVATIGQAIAEHGDAFTAWIDNSSYNAEHPENFREEYSGEYESVKDYAYDFAEQSGLYSQLTDMNMDGFVDWEAYGESLLQDGWYCSSPTGGIYIFSS